jgi:hypothetical protein
MVVIVRERFACDRVGSTICAPEPAELFSWWSVEPSGHRSAPRVEPVAA